MGEDAIDAIGMGEYLFSPMHAIFIRGLFIGISYVFAILISLNVTFFIDKRML